MLNMQTKLLIMYLILIMTIAFVIYIYIYFLFKLNDIYTIFDLYVFLLKKLHNMFFYKNDLILIKRVKK